jgi:hypothetical protein
MFFTSPGIPASFAKTRHFRRNSAVKYGYPVTSQMIIGPKAGNAARVSRTTGDRLELEHAAEVAMVLERQAQERHALFRKAASSPPSVKAVRAQPEYPDDLIPAATAAGVARRAKSTLASWCRSNVSDGDMGFAYRIGGRWFVSRGRLLRHLTSDSSD